MPNGRSHQRAYNRPVNRQLPVAVSSGPLDRSKRGPSHQSGIFFACSPPPPPPILSPHSHTARIDGDLNNARRYCRSDGKITIAIIERFHGELFEISQSETTGRVATGRHGSTSAGASANGSRIFRAGIASKIVRLDIRNDSHGVPVSSCSKIIVPKSVLYRTDVSLSAIDRRERQPRERYSNRSSIVLQKNYHCRGNTRRVSRLDCGQ